MESCWVLYAAFDLPPPGVDPHVDDASLRIGVEEQADEADEYNYYHAPPGAVPDVETMLSI